MKKRLDPLLHNELRLAVMSLLISLEKADFNFLLKETGATRGNLSVQLTKLKEAGYLSIEKSFKDNYPLTTCQIESQGVEAFEAYVEALQSFLKPGGKKS
ncbi:transcriptional regulator [bacterium SCSIO 12741]|nr:transcriptional regulator [bacterium SCSIO 12741]